MREPKIGDIVEYIWPDYQPANGAIGHIDKHIPDPTAPNGYRFGIKWDWHAPNYEMNYSGERADHLRIVCPVEDIQHD